jgi:radical SAM-linked protein
LPLSLGIESYCESFDIRIVGEITAKQIVDSLNCVLPEGIEITGASDEFMKCSDIAFAEYSVIFEFDESGASQFYAETVRSLLLSDELISTKKSKKNGRKVDVEINLKDYIKSFDIMRTDSEVTLLITLAAGNGKNLNPSVLIDRLNRDIPAVPDLTRIKKHRLLTADGKEFK